MAALPEIWAFGLRNPWRYSFDDFGTGATGALIIGDVGQARARRSTTSRAAPAAATTAGAFARAASRRRVSPPTTPAFGPLTDPIYDYARDAGRAVTGGYVYRGTQLPAAYRGRYFFADFSASRVWSLGLSVESDDWRGERRPM